MIRFEVFFSRVNERIKGQPSRKDKEQKRPIERH